MIDYYTVRRWVDKHISTCPPGEIRGILSKLKARDATKALGEVVSQDQITEVINRDFLSNG